MEVGTWKNDLLNLARTRNDALFRKVCDFLYEIQDNLSFQVIHNQTDVDSGLNFYIISNDKMKGRVTVDTVPTNFASISTMELWVLCEYLL